MSPVSTQVLKSLRLIQKEAHTHADTHSLDLVAAAVGTVKGLLTENL